MIIAKSPSTSRALLIGCFLMFLQQLTGINTVMYYAASIYEMAGFTSQTSIWLSAFTAIFQFFGMMVNMYTIEKIGRRGSILLSLVLVGISLIGLGTTFYIGDENLNFVYGDMKDLSCETYQNKFIGQVSVTTCSGCAAAVGCGYCQDSNGFGGCFLGNSSGISSDSAFQCDHDQGKWIYDNCDEGELSYVSMFFMCSYLFFFGMGMGTVPWTYNSEIYPLGIRSVANSISTTCCWIGNIIVSVSFLSIASPSFLNTYGAFWLYSFIAVIGWIILYFKLPETKGLELEEIGLLFAEESDSNYQDQKAFVTKIHEEREQKRTEEEQQQQSALLKDTNDKGSTMPTSNSLSIPTSQRKIVSSHKIRYQSIEDQ